jgi:DNA-binding IclR family transcriptional regulator
MSTTTRGSSADEGREKSSGVRTQTLDRALQVLQLLSDGRARTSQDIGDALGLHRSIVYRILRTFEDSNVVSRGTSGRYRIGLGLATLAQPAIDALDDRVGVVLQDLANAVQATALFCVPQGDDAVVLYSTRPQGRSTSIAVRQGSRMPLDAGAPGFALLALMAPREHEASEVTLARQRGVVKSYGQPYAGLGAIAAPVRTIDGHPAALCVVFAAGDADEQVAENALRGAAGQLMQPSATWEH